MDRAKKLENKLQDGYHAIISGVQCANTFPLGFAWDVFYSYESFSKITNILSAKAIQITNRAMVLQSVQTLSEKDADIDDLIEANDILLEKINTLIDNETTKNKGSKTTNDILLQNTSHNLRNIASWNRSNSSTVFGSHRSKEIVTVHEIVKPVFKDVSNDYDTLWTPKITTKPNAVDYQILKPILDQDNSIIGYDNPYSTELKHYDPPSWVLDPDKFEPKAPPTLEETKLTFVSEPNQLAELVEHLKSAKEIAIDVEHHHVRSYLGVTCLLQITTETGGDFLIDTLALRYELHCLNESFTDPKVLKILHGAESDIIWLQRDLGIYIVGLFDTHEAAKVLNLNGRSLQDMIRRYCNVDISKQYQMSDWRVRPLSEGQQQYARSDTHYLIHVWRCMKRDLLKENLGRQKMWSALMAARDLCCKAFQKPVFDPNNYTKLLRRGSNYNNKQLKAIKALYCWRDNLARTADENPEYIMPKYHLIELSNRLPKDVEGVRAICKPISPPLKHHLETVFNIITQARNLPDDQNVQNEDPIVASPLQSLGLGFLNPHQRGPTSQNLFSPVVLQVPGLTYKKPLHSCAIALYYCQENEAETRKPVLESGKDFWKNFIAPYERYTFFKEFMIKKISQNKTEEPKRKESSKIQEIVHIFNKDVIVKKGQNVIEKASLAKSSVSDSQSASSDTQQTIIANKILDKKDKDIVSNRKHKKRKHQTDPIIDMRPSSEEAEKDLRNPKERKNPKNEGKIPFIPFAYSNTQFQEFKRNSNKGNQGKKFKKSNYRK